MKNASKILSIIACVIGILWSIIGFAGSVVGGAVAGIAESTGNHAHSGHMVDTAASIALAMGALLLFSGILATAWHSYVAGPIYVFCGGLTLLAGSFMTRDV
jgi:hypothetical protein